MTLVSELAIDSIFGLFDKWGHENYIGENVTQLQHSQQVNIKCQQILLNSCVQAALQAEQAGYDDKTVLGAFLHDIGLKTIFTKPSFNGLLIF